MTTARNVSGTFRAAVPHVRSGGAWRTPIAVYVRDGGAWRTVFVRSTTTDTVYDLGLGTNGIGPTGQVFFKGVAGTFYWFASSLTNWELRFPGPRNENHLAMINFICGATNIVVPRSAMTFTPYDGAYTRWSGNDPGFTNYIGSTATLHIYG